MSRVCLLRGAVLVVCSLVLGFVGGVARAADENPLAGLKVSGEAFLDWSDSDVQGVKSNAFTLERGYLTVTKKASDWLSFRTTLDVKQASTTVTEDVDGDVSVSNALDGNYVIRAKFMYAEMALGAAGALTDLRARLGMQHAGPDDFEQGLNPYRAQSRNWLERAGWFGTADLGVGLHANFGGKLDDAKGRTGNSKYDGRYGTCQLLLANGSNYDKKEANNSKLLSGRVSVRPAPDALPGLQLTYAGAFGKDNTTYGPSANGVDFRLHVGMLSYQVPRLTLYAQYVLGENNQAGKFIYTADGERTGLKTAGWSLFGAVKLPVREERLALYGRWNVLDGDKDDEIAGGDHQVTSLTGGASYEIAKGNMFIVAYEVLSYDPYADELGKLPSASAKDREDDKKLQVVYKLEF